MKQNKQLSQIRVSTDLFEKMIRAIDSLNAQNIIQFNITEFRKIAYRYTAQQILAGDFEINLSTVKNGLTK